MYVINYSCIKLIVIASDCVGVDVADDETVTVKGAEQFPVQ